MKRILLIILLVTAFFMLGCKEEEKPIENNENKEYHLNIHYSLNEKEDKKITLNDSNYKDVTLEELDVAEYDFLGYYENNNKIEKINELRDYNLETRYKEKTYQVNIHYNIAGREDIKLEFTKSNMKEIVLPFESISGKVFTGFFEKDKKIDEITEKRNYDLNAVYVDEEIIRISVGGVKSLDPEEYYPLYESYYSKIKHFEDCVNLILLGFSKNNEIKPTLCDFIENNEDSMLINAGELERINNGEYSLSNDYDMYCCFFLTSNKLEENNKLVDVTCEYANKIVITNSDESFKKYHHVDENHEDYDDIELALPLGDIIQFEVLDIPFSEYAGDYLYDSDNDTLIEDYNIHRFACYINTTKLKEFINDELTKIMVEGSESNYADLYNKTNFNVNIYFNVSLYDSDVTSTFTIFCQSDFLKD